MEYFNEFLFSTGNDAVLKWLFLIISTIIIVNIILYFNKNHNWWRRVVIYEKSRYLIKKNLLIRRKCPESYKLEGILCEIACGP